jgi:hypothetical protein
MPGVIVGVRPMWSELARAAQLEREVTGADDRHTLWTRPGLDQATQQAAQFDKASGLG